MSDYWTKFTNGVPFDSNTLAYNNGSWTTEQSETLFQKLNSSIFDDKTGTFHFYAPVFTENIENVQEALNIIKEGFPSGNATAAQNWYDNGVFAVLTSVANSIFETYQFEVPEELKEGATPTQEFDNAIFTISVVVRISRILNLPFLSFS